MMNERGLLDLKEKIDESSQQASELRGKLDHLKSELKTRWDCETLEQAEGKLKDMKVNSEELQNTIDEKLEKIEEKYYD